MADDAKTVRPGLPGCIRNKPAGLPAGPGHRLGGDRPAAGPARISVWPTLVPLV